MTSLKSRAPRRLFAEDTPVSVIEAIKPDVLVKGADYAPDQVVGAESVAGHGGRVLLVDVVSGHGTSVTIARVKERAKAVG
jgi:D-beta-D-heptose 7-phosphate kinase/D-beta-D-heptose 1-phosphate adenosyltransferase